MSNSSVGSPSASAPRATAQVASGSSQVTIELAPVDVSPNTAAQVAPNEASLDIDVVDDDEDAQMKFEAQIGMLLAAAGKNNIRRIRGLLNAGIPATSHDYDLRTALHLAASEGHQEAVTMLIKEGADPNAKDRFGSTPLDDAMRIGSTECITLLREAGATPSTLVKLQAQLIEACATGDIETVKSLMTKDADGKKIEGSMGISPNCGDYDKRTPLHLAVAEGQEEIVRLLLANGAKADVADRWGLTPIDEANRGAARVGSDPIKNLLRPYMPHQESVWSFFSLFFGFWELAIIVLIGLFCTYDPRADGNSSGIDLNNATNEHQADISRVYPLFQDVHVMIFVGFGFLMVFLRKHAYTSVGLTFLIGAFVLQWYQLTSGFWVDAFKGDWARIPLKIENLVMGDFCAGSVLITYGVLLGKVNPSQMLFIAIFETAFYALNEQIGIRISASDLGGTMTIHMFGAFFGYGASWMLASKDASGHENNAANYHSDTMAMIGTIFLWLFWPSFNAALAVSNVQERAIINTVLSLTGSCVAAFLASHVLRREKKFNMVDIQNATLAGGVAMGSCCVMLIQPGSAIAVGAIAGIVSVLGYTYVQPFLESKLGLHDTCGVNNLHGMPSLIGGFSSVVAAAVAYPNAYGRNTGYGDDQLNWIWPKRADNNRTANEQAAIQFAYMCTSVFIGLAAGALAGNFATTRVFAPPKKDQMYRDDEYWEVPQLETPYYFDHRGEIARDEEKPLLSIASETENSSATGEKKVDGEAVTGLSPEVLALITKLERRVDLLHSRVEGHGPNGTPHPAAETNNGDAASNEINGPHFHVI